MQFLLLALLPLSAALPTASLEPRDNITSVYKTHGTLSVWTLTGTKVGCLEKHGFATSDPSLCATFESTETKGFTTYPYPIPSLNYTLSTSEGLCGFTRHNNDEYAMQLEQHYGNVLECKAGMPVEMTGTTSAAMGYDSGVNALIGKLILNAAFAGYAERFNTIGGAPINATTPAVLTARLPDYPLGTDYALIPDFSPASPQN